MTITTLRTTPHTTPAKRNAGNSQSTIPDGSEVRGFALYVGIDDVALAQDGTSLDRILNELRETLTNVAPSAQTHATVALAPLGAGGRNIDVTRIALGEPAARTKRQTSQAHAKEHGVILDLTRHRLLINGAQISLTQREFDLLGFFASHTGVNIPRNEIISTIWAETTAKDTPNERTIDVHIRRLRAKLGEFEDIIRTIRGVGYRFDQHPDVQIIGH